MMSLEDLLAGRPKGTGGQAEELSSEAIKRIDKCLTDTRHEHRNRALLFFGLGTGMRIDEIIGLKIKDAAPHGRLLSRIVLEKHRTKSGRSRTVDVSDQALRYLKLYLEKRKSPADPDDPLFPTRPHRHMNTTYAVQLLSKMFTAAAVANASSHSLRRTHANTLRREGVDLMIIKDQLGHSSLATTQRYLGVDPIEARRAVARLKF